MRATCFESRSPPLTALLHFCVPVHLSIIFRCRVSPTFAYSVRPIFACNGTCVSISYRSICHFVCLLPTCLPCLLCLAFASMFTCHQQDRFNGGALFQRIFALISTFFSAIGMSLLRRVDSVKRFVVRIRNWVSGEEYLLCENIYINRTKNYNCKRLQKFKYFFFIFIRSYLQY